MKTAAGLIEDHSTINSNELVGKLLCTGTGGKAGSSCSALVPVFPKLKTVWNTRE